VIFSVGALVSTGKAARHYPRETMRVVSEIGLGTGILAMVGGSVAIMGFLTLFAGATVAVQGFTSLGNIGVEALTGFLSAYVNVRVIAPVTAGVGLAATIGAGTTAQLGAMRISEEIDALEVMAVRSVPYLVGTRILAGLIAVIPLYALSVLAAFLSSRIATVVILGQSAGVYDHYFSTFLRPTDVAWSRSEERRDDRAQLLRVHRDGRSVRRRCRHRSCGTDVADRRRRRDPADLTRPLRQQPPAAPCGVTTCRAEHRKTGCRRWRWRVCSWLLPPSSCSSGSPSAARCPPASP